MKGSRFFLDPKTSLVRVQPNRTLEILPNVPRTSGLQMCTQEQSILSIGFSPMTALVIDFKDVNGEMQVTALPLDFVLIVSMLILLGKPLPHPDRL